MSGNSGEEPGRTVNWSPPGGGRRLLDRCLAAWLYVTHCNQTCYIQDFLPSVSRWKSVDSFKILPQSDPTLTAVESSWVLFKWVHLRSDLGPASSIGCSSWHFFCNQLLKEINSLGLPVFLSFLSQQVGGSSDFFVLLRWAEVKVFGPNRQKPLLQSKRFWRVSAVRGAMLNTKPVRWDVGVLF